MDKAIEQSTKLEWPSKRLNWPEVMKAQWRDPEFRSKRLAAFRSPEYRISQSAKSTARWCDPEFRNTQLALYRTPEMKLKISQGRSRQGKPLKPWVCYVPGCAVRDSPRHHLAKRFHTDHQGTGHNVQRHLQEDEKPMNFPTMEQL